MKYLVFKKQMPWNNSCDSGTPQTDDLKAEEFNQRYELDEWNIMPVLVFCSDRLGRCKLTPATVLREYGITKPTRADCEVLGEILRSLHKREYDRDAVKIRLIDPDKELSLNEALDIHVEVKSVVATKEDGSFFYIDGKTFVALQEAAKKENKKISTLFDVYCLICSNMNTYEYYDENEMKQTKGKSGCTSAKQISEAFGMTEKTAREYAMAICNAGLMGVMSEPKQRLANAYSIPANYELLNNAMNKQRESIAKRHPNSVQSKFHKEPRYAKRKAGGVC